MDSLLTADALDQLMVILGGAYTLTVAAGVQIVTCRLPGSAVVAAARMEDGLWIFLDFDKPMAHRHARQLLRECCPSLTGVQRDKGDFQEAHEGAIPLSLVPAI